jgi:hypothetical protein
MTEEIRLTEGVMAEEIRVVEHYSASILNKVGEGARILTALRDAGVNRNLTRQQNIVICEIFLSLHGNWRAMHRTLLSG